MSFDSMKVSELREVAENFGVDLEGVVGKSAILTRLGEEGITYEMYEAFNKAESVDPKEAGFEVDAGKRFAKGGPPTRHDLMLVKMERNNFTYEANGYIFTKEHPFMAMTEEEAQHIFDYEEGFRPATPNEVKEYYS